MITTLKKLLGGFLSLSILCSMAVMPQAALADTPAPTPVINITFDETENLPYTLHGATLADGRSGKALSLSGDNQYADINGIAAEFAKIDGDFSISVWCKPESTTAWNRIYDFGNGSSGKYLFLTPTNGSVPRFAVTDGTNGEQTVTAADSLTTDEWHNIIVKREGSLTSMYIDGFLVTSTSGFTYKFSDLGTMQNYYLGKSQFSADPYYKGMIDDFSVYNCAIDEDTIHTIAAEAYQGKRKQLIYENNCVIVDTHFYSDESKTNEIFSLDEINPGMRINGKSINNTHASFTLLGGKTSDVSKLAAYVAEYDEYGTLANVTTKTFTNEEITSDSYDVSIPYTKENAENTVKLFVWDNMEPLYENTTYVSANAEVQNYTAETVSLKPVLYAVAADGTETMLNDGNTYTYESLREDEISVAVAASKIPSDSAKLIMKLEIDDKAETVATLHGGIKGPVAAPADSNTTTNGAHDPSIVKFDNDDTYYVYSSHHLIFTSEDLVNWTKYDFTNINAKDISPKTYSFISSNYTNTTMNGTYWAPDVIYKEGDDHPYWMYISVSCGLGGRNSVISLMKSDSPLFWADEDADIVDAGVVFATKENSSYKTNAIDANIYTDTDGKQYFVWGSFWGGIQSAPLKADGTVEGIDYTSDSTILESCKNFGTSVFTQKNGVAGPEGAWMINHGNYRYMFTSYGWLGSNYNTRIARAAASTPFSTNTGTQLVDANGTIMGSQHSSGSTSLPSGYKLIGSYRLGDGASNTIEGDDSNGYYVSRQAGDAHIYYGPGHNSAITADNGESFYVSHVRKDAIEGAAILEVRKMLFTADGWPVVSPVSYAGEKEQPLPKEMLVGTYDFASVGKTKMVGSSIKARNFDVPVLSSKVTLNADGTMADGLGTWTFDGDHTVTLKFTKNGDESKDEFYKNGDTVTMLALYGYDKDEKDPVIALTGTDQNHITQFAKKSAGNLYKTAPKTIEETTPVVLTKSTGGNPELGFDANGNTMYGGDPAAFVDGDTVYLYVGHDTATNENYVMPEWACYSSKNMTDWNYEGVVMKATSISWRSNDTSAWASQVTKYGDKYYLYYCTWDKTSGGKQSIGVATSSSPTGPFVDKGTPLVQGSFTTPESASHDDIDPTILIDTDEEGIEHRYLAWGNTRYYVCELNEDMVSVKDLDNDGQIVMHKDIKERKIKSMGSNVYTEAPWLYKRAGKYYLFFATNWREEMAYAMADEPMGRYDYKQTIMPPTATSNTNHPSVIDFGDKTYFIYHNGALPHGSGFRRSVCIQELKFDENGYVYPLTETSIGLSGTANTIVTSDGKYLGHEAFRNPLVDASYPLSKPVTVSNTENEYTTAWEIVKAKAVPEGENPDNYVSIQSVDKPGLYITATGSGIKLTQDADGQMGSKMTFKTVKGLDNLTNSVSFESVSEPGKFLTVLDKALTLSYGTVAADSSFTIGTVTTEPASVISVAEREPDPQPEADITQDFNTSTGKLISLATTDTPAYTALNGVTLYIGTRSSGANDAQNFSIQTGGVTGNALVLNTGSYQSASRGPRMKINTPAIPNGYTVTAQLQVKGGTASSILRYNDSTSSETGTEISGLTTSWQTLTVTITNDNDTYNRTIKLGDNVIAEDYIDSFPVLWGTTANNSGQSVYFDDLTIKTTTASGEKPVITAPEPVAKFEFEDNLTDSLSDGIGTLTGATATAAATATEATYVEGKNGKAIAFTGANSYGVLLPVKPSGSSYTISFDAKLNTSAKFSPFVFIADFDGETINGGDDNAQWISIAPQGWQEDIKNGPMIWSRNVPGGSSWNDIYTASNNSMSLSEWHNITVVANGTTGTIYVDKTQIATGSIAAIIDSTTKMYLGVNNWDTPLDGAIDNLLLFNQSLSASQVALIGAASETE